MQTVFTRLHKVLAIFISLGVFVQMFLAGIWHAEIVSTPDAHAIFGITLLLASLLALFSAAIARLPRAVLLRTALLFGLILLQPILIEFRRSGYPVLSALHTLNAAFVGMTAGMVAAGATHDVPDWLEYLDEDMQNTVTTITEMKRRLVYDYS